MGRTIPSYKLRQKEKKENGKYSDKNWIKVKERCLMK
jgi:hypothetical protein